MDRKSLKLAASGISLPLALLVGCGAAFAHGGHGQPGKGQFTSFTGTVTALQNNVLQVQTATGTASATLSSTTHISRVVSGSVADLQPSEQIDATVARGTTTITSIQVEPAGSAKHKAPANTGAHSPVKPVHAGTGTASHTWTGPKTHRAPQGMPTHFGGMITAVTGGDSVTVSGPHGSSTTYKLSSSLTVTKIMNGTIGDLATNETVRVVKSQTNAALSVSILNA